MKDQLVFDTTSAQTIQDSDSVGAFIRSADGTLITHTTVGAKEALDVRVAEGINVEVDLDAADDSVSAWLKDGSGIPLTSTGGGLDVNVISGTINVTDAALANVAVVAAAEVLDTAGTDQAVITAPLANRKYLFVYNNHNTRIYLGAAGVTDATGFPLSPKSVLELRAGPGIALNFVGQSGETPDIRTLELS